MEHTSRLEQLWKAALTLFPSHPSLAASYVRQLMQVAREQSLLLAPAFYWHACSHCGLPWYAGISCRVRLVPYRLIRASMRRLPGQHVLLGSLMGASKMMSGSERTAYSYVVYQCFGCGMRSIFDGHPQLTRPTVGTAMMGGHRQGAGTMIKSDTINVSADSRPAHTTSHRGTTGPPPSTVMDRKKLEQLQKILNRSSSIVKGNSTGAGASTGSTAKDTVLGSFLKGLNNPDKKNTKKP